jgi:hypothetical protein
MKMKNQGITLKNHRDNTAKTKIFARGGGTQSAAVHKETALMGSVQETITVHG